MKHFWIFLIFAVICLQPINVKAFDLEGSLLYSIYDAPNVENRPEIEITGIYKHFTLGFSYVKPMIELGTQEGLDVHLFGIKGGYRWTLIDNLAGFFSIGWYYPSLRIRNAFNADGYLYVFADALGMTSKDVLDMGWTNKKINLDDSLGLTIGLSYSHRFRDWLSFGVTISKRWLNLDQDIFAFNEDGYWHLCGKVKLNSMQFGVNGEIKF